MNGGSTTPSREGSPAGSDGTPPSRLAAIASALTAQRLLVAAHAAVLVAAGVAVTLAGYRDEATLGLDSTRFAIATHLLDGRVPFRTLLTEDPPGAYAFDALVLMVFGRSMGAAHAATLLSGAVVYPLVVYAAARSFVRLRWLAFLAALCVVVTFSAVPGVQLTPAIVALGLAARWLQTSRVSTLFSAGVAGGIGVVFSTGLAAAALAGVLYTIALRATTRLRTPTGHERVSTLRPLAAFLLGSLLGALPFLAAVTAEGSLPRYIVSVLRTVSRSLESSASGGFPGSARFILPFAIVPVLLCVLARLAREETERGRGLTASLIASSIGLRLAAPASVPDDMHLALAVADVPLLAAIFLDWAVEAKGRIPLTRWDASLSAGAGLLVAGVWRLDIGRPAFALVPPAAALVVGTVRLTRRPAPRRRRVVRVTAPAVLLSVTLSAVIVSPGRLVAGDRSGTELSGALWDPALAEQITEAVEALRGASPPESAIFAYPEAPALYELAGRRNPTSFVRLTARTPPADVARALAELNEDVPAAVLVRYGQAAERARALAPITRLLEDRYIEVRRLDRPELWGVWVRREPPEICRRLILYAGELEQSEPPPDVMPTQDGRQSPVLLQQGPTVRFRIDLRPGSTIQFTPGPVADAPEVSARAVEILSRETSRTIWEGAADGIKRRLAVPAVPAGPAELVLRSPPGLTTQWIEPTVCAP